MENEDGNEIILNSQTEVEPNTTEQEFDEEDDNFDWKAEALKAREIAKNQKIRAEKVEKKLKSTETKTVDKVEKKTDTLSTDDLYFLIDAKVPQQDISDVREYASMKGISIADALKSSIVKTILREKAEERNLANATNTGNTKRVSTAITDENLLSKARNGELPDSDEEIQRINSLRWSKK